MPKPNASRYQPGMRSVYGGTIVDRGSDDPVRVIPADVCGRCQGYGRVGDELYCSVCQTQYEPYYETTQGFLRSSLRAHTQRSFADGPSRGAHPAHPRVKTATGVRTQTTGRRK